MTTYKRTEKLIDRKALTQARLKELLHYDPATGIFTWLVDRGARARIKAGKRAGTADRRYRRIMINNVYFYEHRLAFLYVEGTLDHHVDHKDCNGHNNKFDNLRACSRSQNLANVGKVKSAAPYKGAHWDKKGKTWKSSVKSEGKIYNLGYFDTPEEAHEAYCRNLKILKGEFARFE